MGRKDEVINWLVKNRTIETIAKNCGVKDCYYDDFVQEIYLIIWEYDEGKLWEIYNNKHLKYFISRIILNQWNSKTSPFYTKYRKYYEYADGNIKISEDEEIDEDGD